MTARRAGPVAGAEGIAQIGRGAVAAGDLTGRGTAIVFGSIRGVLQVDGDLIVAEGGEVAAADGRASRLRLDGRLSGEIEVAGAAEIGEGGRLEGEIRAQRFESVPGARLDGRLRIDPAPPERP